MEVRKQARRCRGEWPRPGRARCDNMRNTSITGGRVTECKLVLVRCHYACLRTLRASLSIEPAYPILHAATFRPTLPLPRPQLGDSNVGKSSLVLRFVKNQFNADQVTTVGAAFLQSPVPLDDSEDKIQFGIWDTAGSERYKALAPMYYRGADAAIVVYDITSFESFEGAKSWVHELKLYGQPNVVVALAANKQDLEQYRVVSAQEGQAYARENDLTYFETSAKTAHNVRRMFVELGARTDRQRLRAMRARRLRAVVGRLIPQAHPPVPLTHARLCAVRCPSQPNACHARMRAPMLQRPT